MNNYLKIAAEPEFKKEFDALLKDYVGRPTPLYFAKRLSERYNTKIYLKKRGLVPYRGPQSEQHHWTDFTSKTFRENTRVIAETGAGQHGVATATVCALHGHRMYSLYGRIRY